jgi:hypothetical protein
MLIVAAIKNTNEKSEPKAQEHSSSFIDGTVVLDGKPNAQLIIVRCAQDGKEHYAVVLDDAPFKPGDKVTLDKPGTDLYVASRKY